ncbi:hypothetical protein V5G28_033580 [Scytonema sp. PRP1]
MNALKADALYDKLLTDMKTKPFSELRNEMTPERRAKNKTRAQLMLLHLALLEVQQSLEIVQDDLEKDLGAE